MKTEYEVRILEVDVDAIKAKLDQLGAKKVAERNMRRFVYNIDPNDQTTWIRLRDNGVETTLTIKKIHADTVDGTKESEVVVNDMDTTNIILNQLGFFHKAYQENKRISYLLNGVEVEIDFWPKIPPYVEVEGKSLDEVEKTVKLLGFDMSQTTGLGVKKIYLNYGIELDDYKELKFDDASDDLADTDD